jgi:hypothetical protein
MVYLRACDICDANGWPGSEPVPDPELIGGRGRLAQGPMDARLALNIARPMRVRAGQIGSHRQPLLSSHLIFSPSPATPVAPSSEWRQNSPGS